MKVYVPLTLDERVILNQTGRVYTTLGACFSLNPFHGTVYVTDPKGLKTSTVEIIREFNSIHNVVYARIDTSEPRLKNTGWFNSIVQVEEEALKMDARQAEVDAADFSDSEEEENEAPGPENIV